MDEPFHLNAGYIWWKNKLLKSYWWKNSQMPISAINLIPEALIKTFPKYLGNLDGFFIGRFISILPFIGIITIVFNWLKKWSGIEAAILSLILFIIEPNIIPYSQIHGTDVWGVFFALYTIYLLSLYMKEDTYKVWLHLSIIIGVSQLAKQSNIWLYPLLIVVLLIGKDKLSNLKLRHFLSFLAIQIIVISAGFRFNNWGDPLIDYHFYSPFFRKMGSIQYLNKIPIPLPKPFLQGLDMVNEIGRVGGGDDTDPRSTFGTPYLLGQLRPLGSFWYYFFVVWFFKTPITFFILLALSIKKFHQVYLKDYWVAFLMVIFIVIYYNFFYKVQLGVRHTLLIYPLLILFISSFWNSWKFKHKYPLLVLLFVWGVLSLWQFRFDYYPYSNEFLSDKKMAYKIYSDCNLYWHEHEMEMRNYAINHQYKFNPDAIVGGHILISPIRLTIETQGQKYKYLRDNYTAIKIIKNTYLLFYVPEEDIASLKRKYAPENYTYLYAKDLFGPIK